MNKYKIEMEMNKGISDRQLLINGIILRMYLIQY